jgi:succinate dehydrogenase/fumarate reductase flavoprotein subunit
MREGTVVVDGRALPCYSANTLVIGSGAAALKAAVTLHALGQQDLVIATESWGGGTSANAGSDKQTYYKLSLAGEIPDSPRGMARDLFAGGSMHGDMALAEAQHSAQAFYALVALGVPFPHDTFGGFPGYRTDHDPRGRGTSAGPRTSHMMVQALAHEVEARRIPVLDRHQVVALLVDRAREPGDSERTGQPGTHIIGAMALDLCEPPGALPRFVVFNAVNVVLGTGGPGGMYADSVYPPDQIGSIGLALAVGATAQNLTESQFGLASIGFRWNVSGSYQQVLPRYVSTDAGGDDEREFLNEVFPDIRTLAAAVFRKGYQWPFDPRRVPDYGSSLIDLLVYREREHRKRRVFLDYRRSAEGDSRVGRFTLDGLGQEVLDYLRQSGALAASPIERLQQMNPPAIDLYREHGIDLRREKLEIAVCAQHNNGGLTSNCWWESDVRGLFPVGEVNGSHGVYRPGGAALNAGQVGGLRSAMYIARRRSDDARSNDRFLSAAEEAIRATLDVAEQASEDPRGGRPSTEEVRREIRTRMSHAAAHVRVPDAVRLATRGAWALVDELRTRSWARDVGDVGDVFRNRELALAHAIYLEAIAAYIERGGHSRGSYLVVEADGSAPCQELAGEWHHRLNEPDAFVDGHVLEIAFDLAAGVRTAWVPVRPIPTPETWFETVWKAYREDQVVR